VGRFQFGQIIEARISVGSGQMKERPALIISSDEENDLGEPLQVIAITKSIDNPFPKYHIWVHDGWNKHPKTGLTAPCVAKCNWVREVEQNAVIRSIGYMPLDILEVIVSEFDTIYNDKSFNDWV
jgi:mRNA-degrading endonuclease toxin of MazEF toxin-antitoxin module